MKDIYNKVVDIIGKILLLWFILSTVIYFYSGRFLQEIRIFNGIFSNGFDWLSIYAIIKIPVSSIGIFVLIPLLFNGRISGLLFGIIYWIMGYLLNPFWYIIPKSLQITPGGRASNILIFSNYTYSLISLLIIVGFFYYRRSIYVIKTNNKPLARAELNPNRRNKRDL